MKRVAIIGHTGRGSYGHYLDRAFTGVEGAELVALADPDTEGREAAMARSGAPKGYADYVEMLKTESPDIVVVASREIGDHLDLVLNCAASGAHIYMEKPVAASVAEVDEMIAACEKSGSSVVVAHPWRGHPPIQKVAIPLIRSGKIGEPRLARIYGMGGEHGGDQLFLDLYPHFLDFVCQLWGTPLWCHAHLTQDGRSVTPADVKEGVEGMGLVAGDGIKAYYEFPGGVAVDFESYRGDGKEIPYRIDIHGTKGTLSLPGPMSNQPDIYYHPLVNPGLFDDDRWEVIPSEPPPDKDKWVNAHHRMARSMIDMLEGREPEWDLVDLAQSRVHLEMAMMAHASHKAGTRVSLPLASTNNPFDDWK
ncbi:MAG: putative dehydrogenase [Candidatus Latescibacterota bacterium]|jgi:predicted dehydrogenase